MTTSKQPGEETKLDVRKSEVTISESGHVTIRDPRVIEKLRSHNINDRRGLEADNVSVGVVVSKEF